MRTKITALTVAAATLASLPVYAQTAAPAGPTVRQGSPIPGLCVFSQDALLGGSQVGKYVIQRIQQLDAPVEAELKTTESALVKDAQTFKAAQPTLSAEAQEQQGGALNQRIQQLQQTRQIRAQESQVTGDKAIARILTELRPLLQQSYESHNCSLLLNASAVLAVNPANDITDDAIRLLDAKIQQFPFERERADQQQPQPAAPAAARSKR